MAHSSDVQHAAIAELVPELDRLAADAMADWKVPGAAIAVVQDGKVALAKAYGHRDVEANLPVTAATQFVIGSITKSFTATGVALLHNEGRLDWTKPVRDYLPEFRLHDPVATERVTVRDLLCHQSGLPRHDWVWLPGDRTSAELLGAMRYLEPSRDIRAAWQYSNLCYNVAGLLIERASGLTYEAFVRERLTDRLGMTVSFTLEDLETSADAARPYMMHEDTRLPAFRHPIGVIAAGSINTSVADLANWMRLHLSKGELGGERLLPATLINELHAPRVFYAPPADAEFGEAHYGFGFRSIDYRGDRFVWHSGGSVCWSAMMTLVPDFGLGVAVLTNLSPPNGVTEILTRYIVDRVCGREPVNWRERHRKWRQQFLAKKQITKDARAKARHIGTRPAHDLSAYAGDYDHPAYGLISIKEEGGALHWSWRGMFAAMIHRHYETFELPEAPDRLLPNRLAITFLTDRSGNIVSLSAPLEPMVKDIVFVRRAAGDCTDAGFRARCVGIFKGGPATHSVTLDAEGQLVWKPDSQPAYPLAPYHGRRFRIVEKEGFVEFRGEGTIVDEAIFHQPNGTFIAKRVGAVMPEPIKPPPASESRPRTGDERSGLLPRRAIFANPERSIVRMSRDGTRIAFLAPVDGVLNVWVAPLERIEDARPVTAVTDRNLGPWIIWMHDNRHIVFFRDQAGDENWRAWAVDLETGEMRPLTPGPGVKCYVQQSSSRFPSELLIAHNERDRRYFDVYRVDVATGESTLLQANQGFTWHFTDQQFRVRYAVRHRENGDVEYLQRGADGEWTPFTRIGADDAISTHAVEFSADGRELYWLDSRGRNTAAAVAHDLESGMTRVLAEDGRADFTTLLLDPITDRPIAAACTFQRARWEVLDPDYEQDFKYLASRSSGDLTITSISQDRQHWIVAYLHDNAPLEYFHYDRNARQARRLFSSIPELEGAPLVTMEPVVGRSRDGLELVCYLSRPRDAEPAKRLPMVLLVHGGPWSRDVWALYPDHQWLANRGYAVLSVNYRGSTGFGKAFVNAANLEWAGKMHDDLIDAVDWAIDQDIADPDRVAIMGTSYGGYSALVGVTFTPEKFACAVDIVGISNLVTFLNTIPEYWMTWKSIWKVRVGDYTSEAGKQFLQERSPLNRVDRIVRPVLIGQGANDVRVKASESEQIVAAMQQHGIPVTYVYYPDEGHGFGRPENRRSFRAVVEAFLATYLDGRCEPVGNDFQNSTIEFKAGRELIPV